MENKFIKENFASHTEIIWIGGRVEIGQIYALVGTAPMADIRLGKCNAMIW